MANHQVSLIINANYCKRGGNGKHMQILDNVNKTVKDDLAVTVSKGDKL